MEGNEDGRKKSQGRDGEREQMTGQKDDKRTNRHTEWMEAYKGEMTDARKDNTRKGGRRQEGNKEKTKHLTNGRK